MIFSVVSLVGKAQDDKTVIFVKEKVINNISPTARFTPSPDEAAKAKEIIKAHIKEKYPVESSKVNVDDYFIQYYGVILMGQHIVHFNGNCAKPEKYGEEPNNPLGGGICYFSGRANMKSGKMMGFKFNGNK